MRHCIAALLVAGSIAGPHSAAPQVERFKTIHIENGSLQNGSVQIEGRSASLQLLVTGVAPGGETRDGSRVVTWSAMPLGIVQVSSTGMVTPLKEGKATVQAKTKEGLTATISVQVANLVQDKAIHFSNQVVPIFTKFGCNSGGCHGKSGGQNGFRLSLLGFEPTVDYDALVKEARGRRIFPAVPERSLLLLKATGAMAHGGGKRIEPESPHYKVLLRWIQQGAPVGKATDPVVQRIEVLPRERLMNLESEQQLSVVAHFSNGSVEDVTRMAQFESNNTDLATVSETGLVRTLPVPGSFSVMMRYQSHVSVFRAMVPLGVDVTDLPTSNGFIDDLVFAQLKKLGLPPSKLADDSTFLRRATLDLCGRLPTKEEATAFLADQSEKKHEKLIDRLLASDSFADYFANKWNAILRNRRVNSRGDTRPTFAFHKWIRESFLKNKPYDQFVREILTAVGQEVSTPPVAWYRQVKSSELKVEDTAQLFLGQRIQCARCHHHPFEKWSQKDYYGFAAFFSQVEYKKPPRRRGKRKGPPPLVEISHKKGTARAKNPRTGNYVLPTGLGSEALTMKPEEDPRKKLVDWMVQKENPFFAKALVNRYWKHFFSAGLVDPEDDMRVTNPASNPELLEAMARYFIEKKFDQKALIRAICTSSTYRLSAIPNKHNADDQQNYSRYIPKRLHAEVLLDAIDVVTQMPSTFKGMAKGTKAVQLPDHQFDSYFLMVFGRPEGSSACECERSSEPSLAQCLHMMNSSEILSKVAGKRALDYSKDNSRKPEEKIQELYLTALSRPPTAEEVQVLAAHIVAKGKDSRSIKEAYEDVIWAVICTKEFLFNH